MSPAMMNLMNVRYILAPLEGLPEASPAPRATRPLEIVGQTIEIPQTRAAQLEIISFTENTLGMTDGIAVGELTLTVANDQPIILPIRLGTETADWAIEATSGQARHKGLDNAIPLIGYSPAGDFLFNASKYVYRYSIASVNLPLITSVSGRLLVPNVGLTIESVALIDRDASGKSVSLAALAKQSDLSLVYRDDLVALYENRNVLPRAFIVHTAQVVTDGRMFLQLQAPSFQPDRVVLLSDGAPLSDESPAPDDTVEITTYKPEQVVLKTHTARQGFLVLADTWYPDWTATVDGQSAPIARADYIFRAVLLAPGAHTVVFEYHPISFAWGAAISGLAVIVAIVLVGAALCGCPYWTTTAPSLGDHAGSPLRPN